MTNYTTTYLFLQAKTFANFLTKIAPRFYVYVKNGNPVKILFMKISSTIRESICPQNKLASYDYLEQEHRLRRRVKITHMSPHLLVRT